MTGFTSKFAAAGFAAIAFAAVLPMTQAAAATSARQPATESATQALVAYQNTYGSYASLADFSREIEGTPCGMNCMHDAQVRATGSR